MTNTTIQKLINLASQYDRYTEYIDNYRQQLQAERRNDEIEKEFIELAATIGITVSSGDFFCITRPFNGYTVEDAVNKFLSDKGFNVKEDDTMTNTTTNVTVNETGITNMASKAVDMAENIIKEDEIMKKRTIVIMDADAQETKEVALDELALDDMLGMKGFTKDVVRVYLEDEGIQFSNNEFKKTKRAELIQSLYTVLHPVKIAAQEMVKNMTAGVVSNDTCKCTRCGGSGIFYTRVENNIPIKAIPDNGVCYRCNGSGLEPEKKEKVYANVKPATVPVGDFSSDTAPVFDESKTKATLDVAKLEETSKTRTREEKLKLLKQYLTEKGQKNKEAGYGYSVSAHMLCALILKADCGLERLKGHGDEIPQELKDMVERTRQWLRNKGIVAPVVYTVSEDVNVRVYTGGYKGNINDNSHKIKMYPYNKENAEKYHPVSPTIYTIDLSNWK